MTVCKCDRCRKYVDKQVIPRIQGSIDPLRMAARGDDIKKWTCALSVIGFLEIFLDTLTRRRRMNNV